MPVMNAVHVVEPGADLAMVRSGIRGPGEREVLVRVEACGVCHGDAFARQGRFPGIAHPRVPGQGAFQVGPDVGSLSSRLTDDPLMGRTSCRSCWS